MTGDWWQLFGVFCQLCNFRVLYRGIMNIALSQWWIARKVRTTSETTNQSDGRKLGDDILYVQPDV